MIEVIEKVQDNVRVYEAVRNDRVVGKARVRNQYRPTRGMCVTFTTRTTKDARAVLEEKIRGDLQHLHRPFFWA